VAQLHDIYDDDDDDLTMPSLIRTSIACKRKMIHGLATVVSRKQAAVSFFRHYSGIRKDRQENHAESQ